MTRNLEDRSGAGNGSPSRNLGCSNTRAASRSMVGKGSSPTSPDKIEKRVSGSLSRKDEKANGLAAANTNHDSASVQSVQEAGATTNTGSIIGGEKLNVVEVIEWPKIYISLSRKEKEDDFLAMKGTKLPHRPKKRAKNIDRALQVPTKAHNRRIENIQELSICFLSFSFCFFTLLIYLLPNIKCL